MEKTEIGECINVYIPNKDKDAFWKTITDAGYEKDGKGVFMFVMETEPADEDWNQELPSAGSIAVDAVHKWAQANPEKWERIKKRGSAITRNLVDKIMKL